MAMVVVVAAMVMVVVMINSLVLVSNLSKLLYMTHLRVI
jgi:hypothetical protein